MIVPPESVVVKGGRTIRRKVISSLVLPQRESFSPLIVVGNQKSGRGALEIWTALTGILLWIIKIINIKYIYIIHKSSPHIAGNSDCGNILASFRRHLNPAQVFDLSEGRMEEALEWCQLASPTKCTVVVCGGDGTVGWLLSTADKLSLKTNPHVAIFPLGTGKCSLSLGRYNFTDNR